MHFTVRWWVGHSRPLSAPAIHAPLPRSLGARGGTDGQRGTCASAVAARASARGGGGCWCVGGAGLWSGCRVTALGGGRDDAGHGVRLLGTRWEAA